MSSPDWKAMFAKYVEIVGNSEGVIFLSEDEWTPEEWSEIKALLGGDHE